ncbi:glycosyl hydrolase family 28-related protein [Escherichia coli]|uniref:tail fiber/spike domain-containing protein n=1 Tax=Escherichia coli TaxID=562 RepID=UPI000F52697D|nr:glycosyl hydrolase family 28-related protein [Escherichia coli]
MARYNTNNPVPSNQVKDFSDNAQIVDEIVHLQQPTTKDRFGNNLKTWYGVQQDANEAIAQYGWITLDSFEDGNTLTLPNQALRYEATGEYYRWDGVFPKVVAAGSTPDATGGIGPGAWIGVGDASLRAALAAPGGVNLVNGAVSEEDLASGDEGKGDAMVGVKQPFTGSILRTQHDKNTDTTHVADWGAKGDGVTDDAPAINAAIAWLKTSGGGELLFGTGTYLCLTSIDLRGAYISIRGKGIFGTRILAGFTGGALLEMRETADIRISPLTIEAMTIDGAGTAQYAAALRFRHYTKFRDIIFTGGASSGFWSQDAWLNNFDNCGFEDSNFGCTLNGSNHRSRMDGCSFQGCTNRALVIRNGSDGNSALTFNNCDFEFSNAQGIDAQCTDATFLGCYIGEGLNNSVFEVSAGNIRVVSGTMFFGFTVNTLLVYLTGGRVVFEGCAIQGQTYASISTLAAGTSGGFALKECAVSIPTGGNPSFPGNLLLNAGIQKVFAPRLGVDYIGFGINSTVSDVVSGNNRTVTALTVPGPTPVIGLRANLTDMQWRDGELWAVVVTYSSNADFNVRVASTAGGSGTVIGTLPASGGPVRTGVLYSKTAVRTAATIFEIFRDGTVAAGHSLTLMDISFGDSRAMGKDFGGSFGNLYKF